jgi:transposase
MPIMPKPYPKEFRDDVVAVARQGQAPLTQIAKDFGISETCLSNWLKKADIEDGNRPGLTVKGIAVGLIDTRCIGQAAA